MTEDLSETIGHLERTTEQAQAKVRDVSERAHRASTTEDEQRAGREAFDISEQLLNQFGGVAELQVLLQGTEHESSAVTLDGWRVDVISQLHAVKDAAMPIATGDAANSSALVAHLEALQGILEITPVPALPDIPPWRNG
jgi:hypothetical protein